MDFFQKHDKALRKGRLLQAAAVLVSGLGMAFPDGRILSQALDTAFALENSIEKRLEKEEKK